MTTLPRSALKGIFVMKDAVSIFSLCDKWQCHARLTFSGGRWKQSKPAWDRKLFSGCWTWAAQGVGPIVMLIVETMGGGPQSAASPLLSLGLVPTSFLTPWFTLSDSVSLSAANIMGHVKCLFGLVCLLFRSF